MRLRKGITAGEIDRAGHGMDRCRIAQERLERGVRLREVRTVIRAIGAGLLLAVQHARVERLPRRLSDVIAKIDVRLQAVDIGQLVAGLQVPNAAVGAALVFGHRKNRNRIVRRCQGVSGPIVVARGRGRVEHRLRRTHLGGIGKHTAGRELIVGPRAAQARADVELIVEQQLIEIQPQ